MNQNTVEKLQNLAVSLQWVTVEDMKRYTLPQLVTMIANKMNELINEVSRFEDMVFENVKNQNEKIQYLLGEGLHLEVCEVFSGWMNDGTFDTLINHSVLKSVNERIDETNTQLSHLNDKTNSVTINALYPPHQLNPCYGDGVNDDSQNLQSMIDFLDENGGGVIQIPRGVYIVGDINIKSGVSIQGMSNLSTYMGVSHPVILRAKSGCETIINGFNSNASNISGIMFDGNNQSSCGIIRGSFFTIENCHFINCKWALGNGIALQTFIIQNNKFNSNQVAIWSVVDSRVINNTINANGMGIKLGNGSNDNIITSNKIEWNNTIGIEMYQCHNNSISNNIIDRQGQQGIDIRGCGNCTLSSNVFRRNGASTGDNLNIKTHIRSEGNERIVITGNVTIASNTQDDGSGLVEPPYSIIDYSNVDMLIVGNQLKGCTFKSIETYNSTNTINSSNITMGG